MHVRRQARSIGLGLAVAARLPARIPVLIPVRTILVLFAQRALWILARLAHPTLPGLLESGRTPRFGLDLTSDEISRRTGSMRGPVPRNGTTGADRPPEKNTTSRRLRQLFSLF
jgi:hypothetical protein